MAARRTDGAVKRLADLLEMPADTLHGLQPGLAAHLADRVDHLLRSAEIDELTGVLRRGAAEKALRLELSRIRRNGVGLTLCFVDLDHLKEVNDSRGHLEGDALLGTLAASFTNRLRPYDIFGRWGGDEFVCALSGCHPASARRIVAGIAADFERRTGCGFSAGFAEDRGGDLEDLLRAADDSLYQEKRAKAGERSFGGRRAEAS